MIFVIGTLVDPASFVPGIGGIWALFVEYEKWVTWADRPNLSLSQWSLMSPVVHWLGQASKQENGFQLFSSFSSHFSKPSLPFTVWLWENRSQETGWAPAVADQGRK